MNKKSSNFSARFATTIYRYRWSLAAAMMIATVAAFAAGGQRIISFDRNVQELKGSNTHSSDLPRVFDARYDIWFDQDDSGLKTYEDIEAQFIAEDTVLLAFEDRTSPWGVFSPKALATVARLTEQIERVPYVRHVRSLTRSPWIRWGDAGDGEAGLIVTDLFENDPASYDQRERLERTIAVMGAERAAALVGNAAVDEFLGQGTDPSDYIGEPRLVPGIVSLDGRTTALQIQLIRDKPEDEALALVFGHDDDGIETAPSMHVNEAQWSALGTIKDIATNDPSGYQFHLAGMPVFEQNLMSVGMGDMIYVALMFGVITLVLIVLFRRVSGVILPLVVVTFSIMGMVGLVLWAGDLLNNLTAVAPNMITAIGLAHAIHLIAAYYRLRPKHDDKKELITAVIRVNAAPVLLAATTTAIGFFSLMTSDIVPMRMFGYTAGIGSVLAYLLAMTMVPALLSLIPLPSQTRQEQPTPLFPEVAVRKHPLEGLIPVILRRRALIIGLSLAVVVIASIGLARVRITSDFREMFADDDALVVAQNFIEERLTGTGDLEIVFYGGPASAASDGDAADGRIGVSHDFLDEVARFEERLLDEAKDPESPLRIIARIESPIDILRKINQVQNQGRASFYRIPGPEDVPLAARVEVVEVDPVTEEELVIPAQTASSMASQYYIQYENGARPGENLSRLLTADRRGFRLAVAINQEETTVQLAAFERIREIARSEFSFVPGLGAQDELPAETVAGMTMTGKLYLFSNMIDRFSMSLIVSLSLALLLITILIALFFRSLKLGLISIVPNVLPLVVPLGIMGIFGLPLDGPAVLVVAVALGICVDDTIHFFSKYYEARGENSSIEEALHVAFRKVGTALSSTTVVLVLGFGVLMLSAFRPNLLIGQLAVIMIALAWVADFVVTPALISALDSGRAAKNQAPDDQTVSKAA
jgi:predicted RND superfamily exporter protein